MHSASAMPTTDATTPIAIIFAKSPCVSRLATSSLCGVVSSALVGACSDNYAASSGPMEAAS